MYFIHWPFALSWSGKLSEAFLIKALLVQKYFVVQHRINYCKNNSKHMRVEIHF